MLPRSKISHVLRESAGNWSVTMHGMCTIEPPSRRACSLSGRFHLKYSSWRAARSALEQALQLRQQLLDEDPASPSRRGDIATLELSLGELHAYLGLWPEAADYDRKSFAHLAPADLLTWFHYAWYRRAAGDIPGYQATCSEIDRRFAATGFAPNLLQAHQFDTKPPSQLGEWIAQSETAFRNPSTDWWMTESIGLSELRRRNHAAAIAQFDRAISYHEGVGIREHHMIWAGKVLALFNIGREYEHARDGIASR